MELLKSLSTQFIELSKNAHFRRSGDCGIYTEIIVLGKVFELCSIRFTRLDGKVILGTDTSSIKVKPYEKVLLIL